MSCRKSIHALPAELLEQIQEYVEGEVIYIPKKKSSKSAGVKIQILEGF